MNKLYLYTLFVFSFITLVSCDINNPNEDKFEDDPESGWIYFERGTTSVPYSETATIPLTLTAPVNLNGLDVTYMVEAVDNSSVVPASVVGTFTQEDAIIEGELEGSLDINLSDIEEGVCYEIKVTILDTNNGSVDVGLDQNEEEGATVYLTEHYLSTGVFPDEFNGVSYYNEDPIYSFQPTLTPVEGEDNVYEIDTAWGVDFLPTLSSSLDALPYPATLTINNDGSVLIEGSADYATGGEGYYNACDQTITYTLTQSYLTDNTITFDVILTGI
ncbi:hypothetical protein SAMN04488096_101519 [Mesonia phycicola]|uniref:Uncharacterized protein n=1 Tax=Mesonia phycicola TaxID=579105 RepID=A0A1M6AZ33_9FLAO|nr:hypothetical protein [Mesonia phycicola]SHI41764.1 hypothetical protein SAMN04488096_101519 [Mesonia phycicola]